MAIKVIKAEVHSDIKDKLKERAQKEGVSQTDVILKALNRYYETPLKKK